MDTLGFSWDDIKNKINVEKHGVSFDEAKSVFFYENAVEYFDPDHSEEEDRFLMIGLSYRLRMLVVSYPLRGNGADIRIISARKATKKELKAYSGRNR